MDNGSPSGRVMRSAGDISAAWLSATLKCPVTQFTATTETSNWSSQIPIRVELADGTTRALRLKICRGNKFGRSEVDYYTRDYAGLEDAPLVHCWDAQFEPGIGYHVLLDYLSVSHHNRRDVTPNLEYGIAAAEALGRLHRHHWNSRPGPDETALDRYFAEVRPGIEPMERVTGLALAERFAAHERKLRARWRDPRGMSLLHGDINSMNVLTPKGAASPVYFLDRQPFDWSLTYGVAAYDLAYFLVLWWPKGLRRAHEAAILRCWYDHLAQKEYAWQQALADWNLCVEQCLHVPLEWCSKAQTLEEMRGLWEMQLVRVRDAVQTAQGLEGGIRISG